MGIIESINQIQELENFDHQEYFTINDFNDRYLKTLTQSQINEFYKNFEFEAYIQHKKKENQVNVDLLKIINEKWLFQGPKIALLMKRTIFTFYYFEQAMQSNFEAYKTCLSNLSQIECMEQLNKQQYQLYNDSIQNINLQIE